MSGQQVPAKTTKKLSPTVLANLIVLSATSVVLLLLAIGSIASALTGHYVAAGAMTICFLAWLWGFGALYVSIPLSIYFLSNYRNNQNYVAVDAMHRRALNLLMRLPVRRTASMATTMSNLGLLRLCQGKYENAAEVFAEAASYVSKSRRLENGAFGVVIHNNLGVAHMRTNKYVEAELDAKRALEIAQLPAVQKRYRMFQSAPHSLLAAIRLRLGEYDGAVEHYMKALEIAQSSKLPPGISPDSFEQAKAFVFFGLATATLKLGRQKESEDWCDQALALAADNSLLINALALDHLNLLANEYMNNKLFARANLLLELAYSIGRQQAFHPDAIQTLNYYEKLLLLTDRKSEVEDMRKWIRHVEPLQISMARSNP